MTAGTLSGRILAPEEDSAAEPQGEGNTCH